MSAYVANFCLAAQVSICLIAHEAIICFVPIFTGVLLTTSVQFPDASIFLVVFSSNLTDNDDGDTVANETTNTTPSKSPSKHPSYNIDIPNDWFFPGFMSFVTYGPFANANDILVCFSLSDASNDDVLSGTIKRKAEIHEKADDRLNDNNYNRGYTTDQRFTMEVLHL